MRSIQEVEEYQALVNQRVVYSCKRCSGKNAECGCHRKAAVILAAYEGCVPRDFWFVKAKDVSHNKRAFRKYIQRYTNNINVALSNGYGMVLTGDNGVGKSYFLSYILMSAIRAGRTVYYTTLPGLIHDIKKGFDDREWEQRLDWFLSSDFLAIDEVGKERFRNTPDFTFMDTQVERIMKHRFDEALPTLLATNMDKEQLADTYGSTMGSILVGKFRMVALADGDYRATLTAKMNKDMGY